MWAVQEDKFLPLQTVQFTGISELADLSLFSLHLFLILSLAFWIAAPSIVLIHIQTDSHDAVLCTVQWAALSATQQAAPRLKQHPV